MIRSLKNIVTVNVVLAITVAFCYVDYGLSHKFPINEQCLGFTPHNGPPWMHITVMEGIISACLLLSILFPGKIIGARWFSGVFGGLGLIYVIHGFFINKFDHLDIILGIYVWSSHLAFALIGANVEEDDDF